MSSGEKEIEYHRKAVSSITELVNSMKDFLKQHRTSKKLIVSNGKKLQATFDAKVTAIGKARQKYNEMAMKVNGLIDAKNTVISQNRSNAPQEIAKLNGDLAKQEKARDKADNEYKASVGEIQQYHPVWVSKMKENMDVCFISIYFLLCIVSFLPHCFLLKFNICSFFSFYKHQNR